MAVAAAWLLAAGAACARPVHYQCTGYRGLDAEITPTLAQVHFEGQHWTLRRVRDSREAMYVGGQQGVSITMKKGAMALVRGGETLQCKLVTDALAPFTASAPH